MVLQSLSCVHPNMASFGSLLKPERMMNRKNSTLFREGIKRECTDSGPNMPFVDGRQR